ncbi:hypothetical protein N7470_001262 [Penicillium chermesinum]|nr:hypothetical protein N7470_001262 [Penicillium chermesinum]
MQSSDSPGHSRLAPPRRVGRVISAKSSAMRGLPYAAIAFAGARNVSLTFELGVLDYRATMSVNCANALPG